MPLLDRASPPADAEAIQRRDGAAGGMGDYAGMMKGGMMGGGGYGPAMKGGMMEGMMRRQRAWACTAWAGMGMAPRADAEAKKNIKTLTRTDFLIQFLWKPVAPEALPEDPEERKAKLEEQAAKVKDARMDRQDDGSREPEEQLGGHDPQRRGDRDGLQGRRPRSWNRPSTRPCPRSSSPAPEGTRRTAGTVRVPRSGACRSRRPLRAAPGAPKP